MESDPIRILLVDDHYVVRMGLMGILGLHAHLKIVGEADDGFLAIRLYGELQPDVVLMDARMPGMNGIAAASSIVTRWPQARILMLTTYDGVEDIQQALQAGAQGYLLKNSSGHELVAAIGKIHAGQRYLSPSIGTRVAECLSACKLTDRELEVLRLVAKGFSNREIGTFLGLTENTAKTHLKNLLTKLGVHDRTEAVTKALQKGIFALE